MKRGITRALGVILVRNWRTEQGHDVVAGVLIDGAFEPMHAIGQNREEAIEDLVPLFGVELSSQFHRTLHIGEQHRDLFAFTFERGLRLQNLFSEVFRGVGVRRAYRQHPHCRGSLQRRAALAAEPLINLVRRLTRPADRCQPRTAASAELAPHAILRAACLAFHWITASSCANRAAGSGAPIARYIAAASRRPAASSA